MATPTMAGGNVGHGAQVLGGPGGLSTLENEIERAREEGQWKRVAALAEQFKARPAAYAAAASGAAAAAHGAAQPSAAASASQFQTLANFLIGEAKLEDFLEEFPPNEKNIQAAKDGLNEAKDYLTKTIGEDAKRLGVQLDSYILMGKLNFAMGNYTEALRFYERAQLDSLEEKQLPARSLKIMAEAFAVKAMCYEKVTAGRSSSKAKAKEREATIMRCYEVAGDLTLLFLQVC
jgi:tetratricopeptide (TPR) repeat protein